MKRISIEIDGVITNSWTDDKLPIDHTEPGFGDEYTRIIEDITQEVEAEERLQYGKLAQSFGAELIAYIHAVNETKNLSPTQLLAILQDPTLAMIERLLWTGSLVTAKNLISTISETFFSAQEITSVIEKIELFLAENGRMQ